MDQTLDCIFKAQRKPSEREKTGGSLSRRDKHTLFMDRHRLDFDPENQTVTITRASEDVPFACKINGCRMPYEVLRRLLDGDFDHMDGFEWL